jgi:signal recognition particle receptor subunit beta
MKDVINFKLVVTGPFAAGKTTFISAVSEIPVVSTEAGTTEGAEVKDHTTVTMDFGKISVSDETQLMELYLFGTPGQSRFDFMWDILARGMIGYVLLVDATRPETWPEAADIKDRFEKLRPVPMVVAANRLGGQDPGPLAEALGLAPETTVIGCDAIDKESVKQVLITLLGNVVDELEAAAKGRV